MNIYSIKNEKLEFFNAPMYFDSVNGCKNHMQNILMSDADRALQGLKDDLALYWLGTVDFVTGRIEGFKNPRKVCDLRELFDTIPKDSVPRTANQLRDMIKDLKRQLEEHIEAEASGRICASEGDDYENVT